MVVHECYPRDTLDCQYPPPRVVRTSDTECGPTQTDGFSPAHPRTSPPRPCLVYKRRCARARLHSLGCPVKERRECARKQETPSE
ncbi:hypothetical protein CCFV1_ORF047 [Cotesia congregata filamentous virus 1]|uniref:Uncharacterized protein n=1 Tax=Cotesia congregata filamentous virus 1 TaxID=3064291 RepID=A0ABC8QN90_9VIRU|nr:hypothetical protein CCFV1_ORF047 [Cotesia congregata filamentous virus 1]